MADELEYRRVRLALKAWAECMGVMFVDECEAKLEGYFPDEDTPGICCTVGLLKKHQQNDADSVFILAHELGHHLWFCDRKVSVWDPQARARADARAQCRRSGAVGLDEVPLSDAEAVQYVREEEGAWAMGRLLLTSVGFEDLKAYDAHSELKLDGYRHGLLDD